MPIRSITSRSLPSSAASVLSVESFSSWRGIRRRREVDRALRRSMTRNAGEAGTIKHRPTKRAIHPLAGLEHREGLAAFAIKIKENAFARIGFVQRFAK